MRALVLLGGDVSDPVAIQTVARTCGLVIAADGGARRLEALGVRADRLVGDFDSIDPALLEHLRQTGVPVERHPTDKDWTDSEIALSRAIAEGADEIVVVGALGSRPDHGLANQLLAARFAAEGVRIYLFDGNTLMTPLCGGSSNETLTGLQLAAFLGQEGRGLAISLVPLSPLVEGVRTQGLRFPLDGARLSAGSTLGVSNEPTGSLLDVRVECSSGWLMVLATPAV
jgi:thiamine pyrophosphokinase